MFTMGTTLINGQMVPVRTQDAYAPVAYGQTRVAAPGAPNTVPPMLGVAGQGGFGSRAAAGPVALSGGADGALAQAGADRPFDWVASPLPIMVVSIVVALVWLRAIHWR